MRELNVWRPLDAHLVEHVGAGHLVSTEADAFHLPDVAGTDYRRTHAKTTIVVAAVDAAARRLGYLHNAGYFELEGEDFDGALGRVSTDAKAMVLKAARAAVVRKPWDPGEALRSIGAARGEALARAAAALG